ncbi:XP_014782840.1PREDICTED: uncharacterized protein LOC106878209 [Octopus vulgaris]|uniref:XP_014782840.1PREDICTED: uncharacterized protein LOC106878209 n=1 Tax=Octopus vulgaris TaxID=6645 RepID=A0AA36FC56_OCTVU|nr:XP_014782840.1PREDICTED: uncharacterized protein LOC106878209 [Octopus vulgaris]
MLEDSEEKPECKQDAKNLYHKLVKLEYAVLTVIWEEVTESFDKTKKFADRTSDRASLKGAKKFRIEVLNQVYDCLKIQLSKRMDPYEQIAKRFNFLSELMNNLELDENSIKLIILHYKDDVYHELINECYQFKGCLHLRKFWNTEDNTPSKMQCTEVLQLTYEQQLIEVSSNITTAHNPYLTMPVMSCEAERSSSKLSFVKNKFRSTMTEEHLNSLCILSLENDIARKLSYDKTVATKSRQKSIL